MGSKTVLTSVLALALAAALVACDSDKSNESTASDAALDSSASAKDANTKSDATATATPANTQPKRARATSPSGATMREEPPLDVSKYLTKKDVQSLTRGAVVSEHLEGKAPSPTYNAIHLHPGGRDFYGAGLQVWKLDDAKDAQKRVQSLRKQYLAVKAAPKDAPVTGNRAFVADRGGIKSYVFAVKTDNGQSYVTAVSCGEQFCKKGWDEVFGLAKKVEGRLEK